MTENKKTVWERTGQKPEIREEDLIAWENAVEQVYDVATNQGYTKKKVAQLADIAEGTFSSWYSGTYGTTTHNVTQKVQRWLESHAEAMSVDKRILKGPGFLKTPTSIRVNNALLFAQQAGEFSVITLGSGMGKTMTMREYKRKNAHVYQATMRPTTGSVHGMLTELCRVLEVAQNNPAKFDSAIGEKLKQKNANCLLVIDEAQNLHDKAMDELRYFLDEYGIGIALLGNEAVWKRWGSKPTGDGAAQVNRRIGFRVKQLKPHRDDITMLLDGWKVEDPKQRELLSNIAQMDGTLGEMVKTLELASFIAVGAREDLTVRHIEQAWLNRSPEAA